MKNRYIIICIIILLILGCVSEETKEDVKDGTREEEQQQEIKEPEIAEQEEITEQEEEPEAEEIEDKQQEVEDSEIEEVVSEEEEIQQIFDYSKTKINDYSYKYISPTGLQYFIYVKGKKIKIDSLSSDNSIYIDMEKRTAEEWCTSHTKCGRETGKIADLDYDGSYIETPLDWLSKITEAKKIDDGFYYGKHSWKLDTNIGTVIIDSNFGFIHSIEQENKKYLFLEAKFNAVTDADVSVPEYLLSE